VFDVRIGDLIELIRVFVLIVVGIFFLLGHQFQSLITLATKFASRIYIVVFNAWFSE
jgi:hypothetical protein